NLSAVTSMTQGTVQFLADGSGSVIDISALETVSSTIGRSTIEVRNQARVTSPKLTSAAALNLVFRNSGSADVGAISSLTDGGITVDGQSVTFGALTTLNGTTVTLQDGGTADLSNVSAIDRASFYVRDGVTLQLPKATQYTAGSAESTQAFEAIGAG